MYLSKCISWNAQGLVAKNLISTRCQISLNDVLTSPFKTHHVILQIFSFPVFGYKQRITVIDFHEQNFLTDIAGNHFNAFPVSKYETGVCDDKSFSV